MSCQWWNQGRATEADAQGVDWGVGGGSGDRKETPVAAAMQLYWWWQQPEVAAAPFHGKLFQVPSHVINNLVSRSMLTLSRLILERSRYLISSA